MKGWFIVYDSTGEDDLSGECRPSALIDDCQHFA